MGIVKDGYFLIAGIPTVCAVSGVAVGNWPPVTQGLAWGLFGLGLLGFLFMIYFVRDSGRTPKCGEAEFVSWAEETVRPGEYLEGKRCQDCPTVRIGVFPSPLNVHVNRVPMPGTLTAAGYTPGRQPFTVDLRSSECTEHSGILIEGSAMRSLVRQIVGPVVWRVVYWLDPGQTVVTGERPGMMKFGSRLDLHFPAADVEPVVKRGHPVGGGGTVVARLKKKEGAK